MKPSMTRYDDNSDSEEEVERIPPPPKMRRYASVGLKVMPVASMHDDDAPATVTRTFSVGDRLQKQFEDGTWYEGIITKVDDMPEARYPFTVKFNDGDVETFTADQLADQTKHVSIPCLTPTPPATPSPLKPSRFVSTSSLLFLTNEDDDDAAGDADDDDNAAANEDESTNAQERRSLRKRKKPDILTYTRRVPTESNVFSCDPLHFVGKRVARSFDGTLFGGEVISYDPNTGWWKIRYDDGDMEDRNCSELLKLFSNRHECNYCTEVVLGGALVGCNLCKPPGTYAHPWCVPKERLLSGSSSASSSSASSVLAWTCVQCAGNTGEAQIRYPRVTTEELQDVTKMRAIASLSSKKLVVVEDFSRDHHGQLTKRWTWHFASNGLFSGITQYPAMLSESEQSSVNTAVQDTERDARAVLATGVTTGTVTREQVDAVTSGRIKVFWRRRYENYAAGGKVPNLTKMLPSELPARFEELRLAAEHLLGGNSDMVVMNMYDAGAGIGVHVDSRELFARPIVSYRALSDSKLDFGSCGLGKVNKLFDIPLPMGCFTVMEGVAADVISHSIKTHESASASVMFRRLTGEGRKEAAQRDRDAASSSCR